MPAQREEVVVHPDLLHGEHVAPDLRQVALDLRPRRDELVGVGRAVELRVRQRREVDLPVRRHRQRVDHHPGCGDHVGGQVVGDERPQGVGRRRLRRVGGNDVGDEARTAPFVDAVGDAGRRHRVVTLEHRFDLARLDPEAADLDLPIGAAEEVDRPVRQPAREVTGAVQERIGLVAERVGDELLRAQLGPVEISAGDRDAADAQLPGDPDRLRLEVRVEHVDLRVLERTADRDEPPRDQLLPRRRLEPRAVDRRLRQAVGVHEPRVWPAQRLEERIAVTAPGLAGDDDQLHEVQPLALGVKMLEQQ